MSYKLQKMRQALIKAFMSTFPSGTCLRIVMWEHGTLYSESAQVPNPQKTLERAHRALMQERHKRVAIRYRDETAIISLGSNISVLTPCAIEKTSGVEDIKIMRYGRSLLEKDRIHQVVVLEGTVLIQDE